MFRVNPPKINCDRWLVEFETKGGGSTAQCLIVNVFYEKLIVKDRSASVLITVSVCRSKTLIRAAISPHFSCLSNGDGGYLIQCWMNERTA